MISSEYMKLVSNAIGNNQPNILMDLMCRVDCPRVSQAKIEQMLLELSPSAQLFFDIHISGQGGSGIIKPNLTSLTAFYLARCGYKVAKTGSHSRKSSNGSSDFFEWAMNQYPQLFEDTSLTYFDTETSAPWLKYQRILCLNPDFKAFFSSHIIDEVHATEKYTGINGPNALSARALKTHTNSCTHEHVFYTNVNGQWVDEIMLGDLYLDGSKFYNNAEYPPMQKVFDVTETNRALLLGNDRDSYWFYCLRFSVSIILSWYSHWTIPLKESETLFDRIYTSNLTT